MIARFRGLPGMAEAVPRPIVDVLVGHDAGISVAALCDTGALHNRFAMWVAEEIGLDVQSIEPDAIGVGGQHLLARTTMVTLEIGGHAWDAPVSFCEPWPWSYQLLGQEGFLRWFEVTIRAADREMTLLPNER